MHASLLSPNRRKSLLLAYTKPVIPALYRTDLNRPFLDICNGPVCIYLQTFALVMRTAFAVDSNVSHKRRRAVIMKE